MSLFFGTSKRRRKRRNPRYDRQKWSKMYQRGYDDAAIRFSYIPDFENEQEAKEYSRGLKAGYARLEERKNPYGYPYTKSGTLKSDMDKLSPAEVFPLSVALTDKQLDKYLVMRKRFKQRKSTANQNHWLLQLERQIVENIGKWNDRHRDKVDASRIKFVTIKPSGLYWTHKRRCG